MNMNYPPKLNKGDKVAILSPSAGLPQIFPEVFELGLKRLKENFNLEPIEYPTTRKMGSTPEERAKDFMSAWTDNNIKAVVCSIGGDDQVKVIKHLDRNLVKNYNKPFLGFSDATNIALFLYEMGIVSYYGGAIMTQFGMSGQMHEMTVKSINNALFESNEIEIFASKEFTDEDISWKEPQLFTNMRNHNSNSGWEFINVNNDINTTLYGGCLEIIDYLMKAGRFPDFEKLANTALMIETSEEMPDETFVERVLVGLGERNVLKNISALLVGRPKAWNFGVQNTNEQKDEYKNKQRETILKVIKEYNPSLPIIFNMDFGHTDPQTLMPIGGNIKITAREKRIFVKY